MGVITPNGFSEFAQNKAWKVSRLSFENCDFKGDFRPHSDAISTITLSNCSFSGCSFHGSTWINIKFQNCTFEQCDFSFSEFKGCIFTKPCTFKEVSLSSSHTRFKDTSIQSAKLIKAATTNLRSLPDGTKPSYQKARLASTKASVAHGLMRATERAPNPDTYFAAYRCYVLSSKSAKVQADCYEISTGLKLDQPRSAVARSRLTRLGGFFKLIAHCIELSATAISGILNGWGTSVFRPIAFAGLLVLTFSLAYSYILDVPCQSAIIRSIDILLVAGYGKYTTEAKAAATLADWLHLANLTLGVYWYSIFFPTIIRHTVRGA